jgi:phosphoribosylamine-glycine ligase
MLHNPLEVVIRTARNRALELDFVDRLDFGCSITLAGYGYPYVQVRGPQLPVEVTGSLDCDVWWNEVVRDGDGQLRSTGHRIADVVAFGQTLEQAVSKAYDNIRKIRSIGSYYRPDVAESLWPPGNP